MIEVGRDEVTVSETEQESEVEASTKAEPKISIHAISEHVVA